MQLAQNRCSEHEGSGPLSLTEAVADEKEMMLTESFESNKCLMDLSHNITKILANHLWQKKVREKLLWHFKGVNDACLWEKSSKFLVITL